jgi:hypothetical protein
MAEWVVNPPMAEWVVDHLPGIFPLTVSRVCGLYDDSRQHGRLHTADLPVETVQVPQLVGRPTAAGPLLKNG